MFVLPRGLARAAAVAVIVAALPACMGGGSGGGAGGPGTTAGPSAPFTGPAVAGPVSGNATSQTSPSAQPVEGRALWVTRWYADTDSEIQAVVDYADRKGFNILLLQVFGDGYSLYPSAIAPRSGLTRGTGFDPLAVAIPAARARGIEVHAWINAVRVYHGGVGKPGHPDHVMNQHPEWSMVSDTGKRSFDRVTQSSAEIYACPEHDGFRDYLVNISAEIATNYAVGGLHLDYIRFPSGTSHCYCAEHQRKFQAQYGKAPTAGDPDWASFRYGTINRLIAHIHDAVARVRPLARLSATKTSFFSFQDPKAWFRESGLDILYPMIYTSSLGDFERKSAALEMVSNGRQVMPGISVKAGAIGQQIDITRTLGSEGFALFASSQLDSSHDALLDARLSQKALVPKAPWQDGTADEVPPLSSDPMVLLDQDRVTVEWETDERTYGRVEVRTSGSDPSTAAIAEDPNGLAWEHRATVTGLTPQSDYTLHVVSTDADANWRSSADQTVTTASQGPPDLIVDDGGAGYVEVGGWNGGGSSGGHLGDYRYVARSTTGSAWAEFRPPLPRPGAYRVSVFYVAGSNRVSDAGFSVAHAGGATTVGVDQRQNGKTWVELGTFRFDAGSAGLVKLTNRASSSGVVVADAARFEYLGP
ncbi:family 10 glycosylhydrolase [Planctomycetota bacterium]